jgi:multisubunit Na+/H+ antiporter MnhF subunit
VTAWTAAAGVLVAALAPCAWGALHGEAMARLPALVLTGNVVALLMAVLAVQSGRTGFLDLALTAALLALGSGLVFARFLERWL